MFTFAGVVDCEWVEARFSNKYEAIEEGKKQFPKGVVIGEVDEDTQEIKSLGMWLIYECDECGAIYETFDTDYRYCISDQCVDKDIGLVRRHEL